MRKKKYILYLLCCLLLVGCGRAGGASFSAAQIKKTLTADCSFTAEFTYDTVEGCAIVERSGEMLCITLTEPEVLTGLSFVLDPRAAGGTTAGTEIDLLDHTIHEEALAAVLQRALAGADELTVTQHNGSVLATAIACCSITPLRCRRRPGIPSPSRYRSFPSKSSSAITHRRQVRCNAAHTAAPPPHKMPWAANGWYKLPASRQNYGQDQIARGE